MKKVLCGFACVLLMYGAAVTQVPKPERARVEKIEAATVELPSASGGKPQPLSLDEAMKAFHVPGVSIAVIQNYKIAWAKGYGVIEPGSQAPVTTKTLFQAGSISKPVAAAGALSLVQQGKLSLDEELNKKLKSWQIPDNDFTKTEKVTLRRLMSHTAGLTIHGFPGYDINDPLPTLVQIFNGEKPANTQPIRVDMLPGAKSVYSGGGITIEQQLMIDVSGKLFPALMRELVLDKIGMTDSSYEQPLPPARAALTAGGAYMDGKPVHGRWHVYPEMAAAGLWTTPSDLARFAIEIALSKRGKSNRILTQATAREMLTPVIDEVGLGVFMEKDNPGQFGHNGADEGFQALLTMNADTGNGVAIMADSDNGIAVADLLLRRVAKEYSWNYKQPPLQAWEILFLTMKTQGAAAGMALYDSLKKSNGEPKVEEATLNELGYHLLFSGETDNAIQVFQKNVQEYPQSANVYDSLGEAYMKAGQKDLAIQNYEKTLQIKPDSPNAVEQLKKLKGEEGAMNPKVRDQAGFTVVGVATRTSNAQEASGSGVIAKQWGRLFSTGLLGKIPNKADQSIIAVYTDYAGDNKGEYTFLLGARVTSDTEIPEGMTARKIPAGKYAMFTSERGPGFKVVPEAWMRIYQTPKSAMGGDRAYGADFEIYDLRAADPQNLQTDIYVGIK